MWICLKSSAIRAPPKNNSPKLMNQNTSGFRLRFRQNLRAQRHKTVNIFGSIPVPASSRYAFERVLGDGISDGKLSNTTDSPPTSTHVSHWDQLNFQVFFVITFLVYSRFVSYDDEDWKRTCNDFEWRLFVENRGLRLIFFFFFKFYLGSRRILGFLKY